MPALESSFHFKWLVALVTAAKPLITGILNSCKDGADPVF